jgi:hypothetical protein
MSWFKNIFGKDEVKKKVEVQKANIEFASFNYPPKILLAWIKALEGNTEIGLFLLNNGYEELYHTHQALLLNQIARNWLLKNGYPHLMAFINASEGNESAQKWLSIHGFEVLCEASKAVDGDMESFKWLNQLNDPILFQLIKTIKQVKDQIEFNHNDMYTFGKDY